MSDLDNALAEDLRRLFADERLDVPAAPGAQRLVVAGARRVRRRRDFTVIAAGGCVVIALLAVGVVFAEPLGHNPDDEVIALPTTTSQQPADRPSAGRTAVGTPSISITDALDHGPAARPTPTELPELPGQLPGRPAADEPTSGGETPAEPPVIYPAGPRLGPDGYEDLTLGMSFADAQATGRLAEGSEPPTGCATYRLAEGANWIDSLIISETYGLVRLTASGARTPQDQGNGSTIEELKAAYPDGWENKSSYTAPTGSGGRYEFALGEDAVVLGFYLHTEAKHDCVY